MSFVLRSPSFAPDQPIPSKYTCEGRDVSPPLEWGGAPPGTRSFALVVDDPDAPDPRAPRVRWVHWVLFGIPADASSLAEGASVEALPDGAHEGLNDWGTAGYRGPSPPIGRHRYVHTLFALDTVLAGLDRPDRAELERAMKGHVLQKAELMGTYEKRHR